MLVVIAIIAILASMMSPSLMRTLDSARAVACLNNLKQAGIALTTYSGDFSGWIPGSQVYGRGYQGQWNSIPWSGMLVGANVPGRANHSNAPIAGDYVGNPEIFFCPSAYRPPDGYNAADTWGSWRDTYGIAKVSQYNTWQGVNCGSYSVSRNNSGDDVWIHLAKVHRPSAKALVGDTVINDGGENLAKKTQFSEWEPHGHWDGHTLHQRHLDKVSVWFGDGHVAAVAGSKLGEKDGYQIQYTTLANGDLMTWFNW